LGRDESHELLSIIMDRSIKMQKSKIANCCERWPKSFVDEVNELIPGWWSVV
jgi:hypothetical protein